MSEQQIRAIEKYADTLDEPSKFKCSACGTRLTHYDVDLGDLVECCPKHGFRKVCQECFCRIEEDSTLKEHDCFHNRFKEKVRA